MSENLKPQRTPLKKVIRGLIVLGIGFIALFGLRLGYGFLTTPPGDTTIDNFSTPYNGGFGSDQLFVHNNYASTKKTKTWKSEGQVKTATVDQKYEKVATMTSATKQFDEDEQKLRQTVKDYDALIQYEQSSGMKGDRNLFLTIGVDPDKFDQIIVDLREIGKLTSIQINKTDKTNEFLNLQAQITTLEKTRESLISLKSRSGAIRELVDLENQILDVERQLQNLGVSLGDFDKENEFCTVKMTLSEYRVTVIEGVSFLYRVRVAFSWSARWYGTFIVGFLFSAFSVWLAYEILRQFKWVPRWIKERIGKKE